MVTRFNDPDALIGTFFHLTSYPSPDYALDILHRIASLVKPIMRRHNFRISKLAEFYPEMQTNLLGLNTSFPGTSNLPIIQLRLRQPYDSRQFLPYESVVQTMLHELTHCVFGPHDDKFWKMFRSLQEELETLRFTGYTGEGFLGNGQQLGGVPKGLSSHEAKKKAREAAENRRKGDQGRGRILGSGSLGPIRWLIEDRPGSSSTLKPRDGRVSSAPPSQGSTSRGVSGYKDKNAGQTAAEAAMKREKEKKKATGAVRDVTRVKEEGVCNGVRHSTAEVMEREIAQMHGFESVAQMESANEQAIMAAAIELLEEADREEERLKAREGDSESSSRRNRDSQPSSTRDRDSRERHVIDLTMSNPRDIQRTKSAPVKPNHEVEVVKVVDPGWNCQVCTFRNEESHLQCSLCRVERNTKPQEDSETRAQIVALKDFERRRDANGARDFGKGKRVDRSLQYQPSGSTRSPQSGSEGSKQDLSGKLNTKITIHGQPTWKCGKCGWFVGQEWWSCGNCGTVKQQS